MFSDGFGYANPLFQEFPRRPVLLLCHRWTAKEKNYSSGIPRERQHADPELAPNALTVGAVDRLA